MAEAGGAGDFCHSGDRDEQLGVRQRWRNHPNEVGAHRPPVRGRREQIHDRERDAQPKDPIREPAHTERSGDREQREDGDERDERSHAREHGRPASIWLERTGCDVTCRMWNVLAARG